MDASTDARVEASTDSSMDAASDGAPGGDAAADACVGGPDCGSPLVCEDATAAPCNGNDIECRTDGGASGALCSTGMCRDGTCQPYPPVRLQRPTGPMAGDLFGDAVALQDRFMVIGVPYDDTTEPDGGAAYAYVLQNDGSWGQGDPLAGSRINPSDHFGEHIDIDGQRMVIGADHSAGEGSGALGLVYVFERTGEDWMEVDVLPHTDDSVNQTQFGNRVAIDGDWIVITSFTDTYFYHYGSAGWEFSQPVGLGKASRVDIENTTAVMSFDDAGDGRVFVFEHDSTAWQQSAELVSDDNEMGDRFGRSSLALQGDTIAVSAHTYVGSGPAGAGAVYVFERSNGLWSQTQRLQAPQPADSEEFGSTVALDGQRLAVGVPLADTAGQDAGAIDVFTSTGSGWTWQRRVVPSQPTAGDKMGFSDLRLSGRFMVFSGEEAEVSGAAQAGVVELVLLD